MIHPKYNCFQVMIPKTASKSIFGMIKQYNIDSAEKKINTESNCGRMTHPMAAYDMFSHGHVSYRQWDGFLNRNDLYDIYGDYLTFSFVRNPYHRFVSMFTRHYVPQRPPSRSRAYKDSPIVWMKTRMELELKTAKDKIIDRFQRQAYFLLDEKGEMGVNYIGKVEEIKKCYNELRCMTNPSLPPFIDDYFINASVKVTDDPEEYLTDELKESIYELYKEDFDLLGYEK